MSEKSSEDFQFNYISTAYEENNISSISPFFFFSNAVLEKDSNSYSTVNLGGENSSLLNINNSLISKFINWDDRSISFSIFQFDKFTNQDFQNVKNGQIGGFLNFNFNGSEFKNSLLGKIYKKFNLWDERYSDTQKTIASEILQYFRDLYRSNLFKNVESFILEYLQNHNINSKSSKSDVVSKICDAINYKKEITLDSKSALIENGFNGKIGRLILGERTYNYKINSTMVGYKVEYQSTKNMLYYIGDEIDYFNINPSAWSNHGIQPEPDYVIKNDMINDYQSIFNAINNGIFEIRNTARSDFFAITPKNNNNLMNKDFFATYLSLLGKFTNFDIKYREQAVAWNNNVNGNTDKFKIVDVEDLQRNNEIRIFEQDNNLWNDSNPMAKSIMITPMYAKENNLHLGDVMILGGGQEYQIGAIGGDTQNVYPLIYDTDIIPNQSNEAVIYVNSNIFRDLFSSSLTSTYSKSFGANQFQDTSNVSLKYLGDNNKLKDDINLFKTYFADNIEKLSDVSKNISNNKMVTNANVAKFKDLSKDTVQDLRINLLFKSTLIWTLTNVVIGSIFIILSIYVLTKSIQKIITKNKHTLGILKASGFSTLKISATYPLIVTLFAPILILFGSLLSFFLIKITSNIFVSYFVIREFILFDWKTICIVFFVISIILLLVSFSSAYLTLKVNPLKLINDIEIEKNSRLVRWVDNFKLKKFNSRLGLKIGVRALPSIRLFAFMTFVSMFAITISSSIPYALNNGDKKYYANEKWNVETKYNQSVSNNPFAELGEYHYNGFSENESLEYPISENALIPRYVKINNQLFDTYKNTAIENGKFKKFDEALLKTKDTVYNYMQHSIIDNFLQLKSVNLSLGILKTFVDAYPGETSLGQQIVFLVSNIIPKIFGQKEIDYPYLNDREGYFKNLKYCLEKITNSILPSLVKETWFKNENNANTFILGVGSIPVNSEHEELFTWINGNNGDSIYGINEDSKFIDNIKQLTSDDNEIPVFANTRYLISNKKQIGSEINESININELKLNVGTEDEPIYVSINKDDWLYNDKKISEQKDINLSNLTATLQNYQYANKNCDNYTDLEKVSLLIDKESVSKYKNHSAFFDPTKPWCTDEGDKWKIKVFDFSFDENNDITDISGLKNAPLNWITKARKQKFITSVSKEKIIKLKIVGEQKSYDKPKLFTSKKLLNNAIEAFFEDRYFNGKFSTEKNNFEETKKYILFDESGIYSIGDFSKLKSAINTTDYVYLKKEIIGTLSSSLTLLLFIPTIFIIVFSIIIITLAINWLLQQFKKVIALFKVIGYSNSEILNILLKMFIPPIAIGWLLGDLTVHLSLIAIINKVLQVVNIPISISYNPIIIIIPFVVLCIMFTSIFAISFNRTRKMHIQEILEI